MTSWASKGAAAIAGQTGAAGLQRNSTDADLKTSMPCIPRTSSPRCPRLTATSTPPAAVYVSSYLDDQAAQAGAARRFKRPGRRCLWVTLSFLWGSLVVIAGARCHIRRGVPHYCIGEAQNPRPPRRNHTLGDPEAECELEEAGWEGGQFTVTEAVVESAVPFPHKFQRGQRLRLPRRTGLGGRGPPDGETG